jgi:hypothetical protein
MSRTPKINKVWNKQEKRIVRLLYRKGFEIDLSTLYWASYKETGKKYRHKGSRLTIRVIVMKSIFVLGTIGENVMNIL